MNDYQRAKEHIREVQSMLWHCREKLRVSQTLLDDFVDTLSLAAKVGEAVDTLNDLNSRLEAVDTQIPNTMATAVLWKHEREP